MRQGKNPRKHERHSNHDEEVAHINSRRIRTQVDRPKGKDSNKRSTQQRHGGFASNDSESLQSWLSFLQVDKNAIHNHDGIIHQHTHGKDERSQRNALKCAMHGRQHEQRTKHDGNQTDTDDGTRLESH